MLKQNRTPWLGKEPSYEAEIALGRFLVERSEDFTIERIQPPESYLIATALQLYIRERGKEIVSLDYAIRAARMLIKFFGPRAKVSCITPPVLKRYEHERKRRPRALTTKKGIVFVEDKRLVTKGTIRRELSVLASALNHAVKYRRLTVAPPIYKPGTGVNRRRFLNKNEIRSLLSNCSAPHIKLFVMLAINTGGRKGALLSLKWDQVDFENGLIFLNPHGRQQTTKFRAIVPMNDALRDALIKAKVEQEAYVQRKIEKTGQEIALCEHVVACRNRPVGDVRTGFKRSCERSNVKDATPHTLRHTAGTLMALAGVDFFLISKVLGHSMQTTTELYAHFAPDHLRKAVGILGEAMPTA